MLATALSAGTVLAAEAAVRTRVNRAPHGALPRTVAGRVRICRAHNRGLVGSRLEDRPALATAAQTVSAVVALGVGALANLPASGVPAFGRVGAGLIVGGALANTGERLLKGHVTDYVHLKESPVGLLRRRIWNLADAAIFNGAILTAVGFAIGGNV